MKQKRERFPLRMAYPFAERHGLSAEVVSIRETRIKWGRTYNSTVRRGRMIELLKKHGLLSAFISQGWKFGRLDQGETEMRHCVKVTEEYDSFLAEGKHS